MSLQQLADALHNGWRPTFVFLGHLHQCAQGIESALATRRDRLGLFVKAGLLRFREIQDESLLLRLDRGLRL
ncbi:hypothetical protein D3C75_1353200 [compost metagenome]